ncbi:MAG: T9SS type A sorting domain-containing protein, partial [Luteibaculum sp.]
GGDINGYTNYAINSPDAGISFGLMINRDQADREFVTEELLKVLKNASVGITDNFDPGVKIFPNPASEQIFVQGLEPNSKISIINSLGKTVLVSTQSQMDVSSLSDGVYVLQCFKDGKMITQRFSVE